MEKKTLFAVLTGDLIGSSKFKGEQRKEMLQILKDSFNEIVPMILPGGVVSRFEIYRGDSFQGVISRPEKALSAAVGIRAGLLSGFRKKIHRLDARIAIGIGTIDFLPEEGGRAGDGEAFLYSGQTLDGMKKGEQNLIIKTPWQTVNEEFLVECALFDAIINRWTFEQAQAVLKYVKGLKQEEIARELRISQPAVGQRLKTAGTWAIQDFLKRYMLLIEQNIRSKPDEQ